MNAQHCGCSGANSCAPSHIAGTLVMTCQTDSCVYLGYKALAPLVAVHVAWVQKHSYT